MTEPLYLADLNNEKFQREKVNVYVVCVGDSLTGWNNTRGIKLQSGPYVTYPRFLQELLGNRLKVADCGIAGEISDNGPRFVNRNLELFLNSKYFVLGYGTNDFGYGLRDGKTTKEISDKILYNVDRIIKLILSKNKRPVLLNIPYVNRNFFSNIDLQNIKKQRDYHNRRLREYCTSNNISLADICSAIDDSHFVDSIHPDEEGAKIIAKIVYNLILEN